jgi:ferric iron reductase protein FhuF
MTSAVPSPVVAIYDALREMNASWSVDIGTPSGPGWIEGTDLRDASRGPLRELLERIGARAKTADRKTIAASFALRYGWSSAMAIAPYLRSACIPDVALENVAFKFRESAFYEKTAIHDARGTVVAGDPRAAHPSMHTVSDGHALLRALRDALAAQSGPVVDALHAWSGFARRATWGMLTSSWASHFTGLAEDRDDQRPVAPQLDELFAGDDIIAEMRPAMRAVDYKGVVQLYQRRASCCRYYLLPEGDLCASCPLVPDDERLIRNRHWMKTQLERRAAASNASTTSH